MKTLRDILIVLAGIFAIFVVWQKLPQRTAVEYLPADTVILRDTIRDTVLVATASRVVRTDTVWLPLADTAKAHPRSIAPRSTIVNDSMKIKVPVGQGELPVDTVFVAVEVPIERKTYQTDSYKAVVEGFRPALVEMELYPQTMMITQPVVRKVSLKPKWGLGLQVGYGLPVGGSGGSTGRPSPYIGIGLQYNLLSW